MKRAPIFAFALVLVLAACGPEKDLTTVDGTAPKADSSTKVVFPERVGEFEKLSDDAPEVVAARKSLKDSDPDGELYSEISFYERPGGVPFQLLGSNPPPGTEIYLSLHASPETTVDQAMKGVPVTGVKSFVTGIDGLFLKCGTLAEELAQMCVWADKTSFAQLIMAGVDSSDSAAEFARLFIRHVRVEA